MSHLEASKVLFQKIHKLDPNNVSKIMRYLLLKDEMNEVVLINVATSPDYVIQSLIDQVKADIGLLPKYVISSSVPVSSSVAFPYSNEHAMPLVAGSQQIMQDFSNQPQFLPFGNQLDYTSPPYYPMAFAQSSSSSPSTSAAFSYDYGQLIPPVRTSQGLLQDNALPFWNQAGDLSSSASGSGVLSGDRSQFDPQVSTGQKLVPEYQSVLEAYCNNYNLNYPQVLPFGSQAGQIPSYLPKSSSVSSSMPLSSSAVQFTPQNLTSHQLVQDNKNLQVAYNSDGLYINPQSYPPQLAMPLSTNMQSSKSWNVYPHPEEPFQLVCEDYSMGFCGRGEYCRFLHMLSLPNGNYMVVNRPNSTMSNAIISSDMHLGKIEKEFVELLKNRRGIPVPVSCLPILYNDTFKKILPVESHNLTKLLDGMQSSIRVIDKPQGMLSVILEDDYMRYMKFAAEREKHGSRLANECHVYVTFPQGNNILQKDVENYFATFGMVQEVQIPTQDGKKMYGLVTFFYPETASLVLSISNPHYICGQVVMVKPFGCKPVLEDRKTADKGKGILEPSRAARFPDAASGPHQPNTTAETPRDEHS